MSSGKDQQLRNEASLQKRGLGIPKFLQPAPPIERLSDAKVKRQYPIYRRQILEATFIGYGLFYLVRNNLAVVAKDLDNALGYTHSQIGMITALTAIAYGLGKFLLGSVSDRSNVRRFMALGLLLTAICNFAFGSVSSHLTAMCNFALEIVSNYLTAICNFSLGSVSDYSLHLILWMMNGFVQGMGWGPCGRSMGHWFSVRERGLTFSIWNTSHNVGGGLAGIVTAWAVLKYGGWEYGFYVPGAIALVGAVYLLARLRDTPQSVGLPPVEEYRNDYTEHEREHGLQERELGTKELFFQYVLFNKYIWLLAFANFFAYITRYGMMDWGPMYLREVKHATLATGGIAILVQEFGGIPSTIILGWLSDRLGGRRGIVAICSMVPVTLAFVGLILNPPGNLWLDMIFLAMIGCFIYPVINLFTIMALDFTSKKAIGTAAGFIGLFGYLGRSAQAIGFGSIAHYMGDSHGQMAAWNTVLWLLVGCGLLCIGTLTLVWNAKPKF